MNIEKGFSSNEGNDYPENNQGEFNVPKEWEMEDERVLIIYRDQIGDDESVRVYIGEIPKSIRSYRAAIKKDPAHRADYEQLLKILPEIKEYLQVLLPRVQNGENLLDIIEKRIQEITEKENRQLQNISEPGEYAILMQIRRMAISQGLRIEDLENKNRL